MPEGISKLQLRLFDGARQPFSKPADFLVTIMDGNQNQLLRKDFNTPLLDFDLPFYDNFGDSYTVNVFAEGYKQAGFTPVKLSNQQPTGLDIMLVANDPGFNFAQAPWPTVATLFPFLSAGLDAATAETRYNGMLEKSPVLACMLNLIEAMGQIDLGQGKTPLDYIKQLRGDMPPAQDRFFAYCDATLVDAVRAAAARGEFAAELDPAFFHSSATASWKQVQFGEANVQLTFHQNAPDCAIVDGIPCVTLEPDIDYYKDLGAHALLEVLPNAITHSLTNPVDVYVLRWMAGRHAGAPEFAPLYILI